VAVSAGPLPGDLPLLRERVRLTLSAGGVSAAVDGEVNPGWHSADSLIVRRSGALDPDTYLAMPPRRRPTCRPSCSPRCATRRRRSR
jgi:hypothetical protein